MIPSNSKSRWQFGAQLLRVCIIGLALLTLGKATAQTAKAEPILTITSATTAKGAITLDRAAIEAIGMETMSTSTPWHDGTQIFEGVPLEKLLVSVNATGQTIQAIALNKYVVEFPRADLEKYHVILALKRNGEYMPVRDRGPLFIIYPFDTHPEINTQAFYARCAWQVAQIVVK